MKLRSIIQQHPIVSASLGLLMLLLLGVGGYYLLYRSTSKLAPNTAGVEAIVHCQPKSSAGPYLGMVWVPSGQLQLGDSVYPEEGPIQSVRIEGFWMDQTEVSNDQFAAFVNATGYVTTAERTVDGKTHPDIPADMLVPGAVVFNMPKEPSQHAFSWWRYTPGAQWRHPGGPHTSIEGRGSYPVVAITYDDAKAYAAWKQRSLPTEAQWEWAARGGQANAAQHEANLTPTQPSQANTWQGFFPFANSAQDGFIGVAPAGCYSPNDYGLYDMIGNVWELTADIYTPNHKTQVVLSDPIEPMPNKSADTIRRVIKGGSFLCAPNYCMRYRAGARQPQEQDLATSHLGFRTILKAPGPSVTQ